MWVVCPPRIITLQLGISVVTRVMFAALFLMPGIIIIKASLRLSLAMIALFSGRLLKSTTGLLAIRAGLVLLNHGLLALLILPRWMALLAAVTAAPH